MAPPRKKPPTSKFKSAGAGVGSPFKSGKKDDRHVLMYEGVQQGVMIAYLKKHNAEEEPFFLHDYKLLNDNPTIMEGLGINAILSRKDGDGGGELMQSPTSTYAWRQFVLIIGESNNTPAKRKEFAEALVNHFNSQATSANYRYVRKVKLGRDFTPRPLLAVDTVLLDEDVIGLMQAAYEDTPLEEVATFDGIMRTFWTDLDHGRDVVAASLDPAAEDDDGGVGGVGANEECGDLEDTDEDND
jgi:hypothetical protein